MIVENPAPTPIVFHNPTGSNSEIPSAVCPTVLAIGPASYQ